MQCKLARKVIFGLLVPTFAIATAAAAATVSGSVVHRASGEPIADFQFYLWDEIHGRTFSPPGIDGEYRLEDVPSGRFEAFVTGFEIVPSLYPDIHCQVDDGRCLGSVPGATIEIDTAVDRPGLDFTVDRLSTVTGEITLAPTVSDRWVTLRLLDADTGALHASTSVYDAGRYTHSMVRPGRYRAVASGSGVADAIYPDLPCIGAPYPVICSNLADGTVLVVGLDSTLDGIDFALDPAGSISGNVVNDATGQPISSMSVVAKGIDRIDEQRGRTAPDGTFVLGGLEPGLYRVATDGSPRDGYNNRAFDGIDCPDDGCGDLGTAIEVQVGQDTPGVELRLRALASISGTVRDAHTGSPISGPSMVVFDSDGRTVTENQTLSKDGTFTIGGLLPGRYVVTASSPAHPRTVFGGGQCPVYTKCRPEIVGTPIEVARDAAVAGIDFELLPTGTIAGRLVDALTDAPPTRQWWIEIYSEDGIRVGSPFFLEADGTYLFPHLDLFDMAPLAEGRYFVFAGGTDYLTESFGGRWCPETPGDVCAPSAGTPVSITAGAATEDVDIALDRSGRIRGRWIDATTGEPNNDPVAFSFWVNGERVAQSRAGTDGQFSSPDLLPARYTIVAESYYHLDQVYDGVDCPGDVCDPTSGAVVEVEVGETVDGVDFALRRYGGFTGRVVDDQTAEPLIFYDISLWNAAGEPVAVYPDVATGPDGSYTVRPLPPGTYFAAASSRYSPHLWLPELYGGAQCPGGFATCDVTTLGTPIVVPELGAMVSGIDFPLTRAGTISGRLTHAPAGLPLESTPVTVFDATFSRVGGGSSTSDGSFVARGYSPLFPGSYYVTAGGLDFVGRLFDDIQCPLFPASCDPSKATRVTVRNRSDTGGIDFALGPAGWIHGHVVDTSGEPIENVEVRAHDATGAQIGMAYSSRSGEHRTAGLPAGAEVYLVAHKDGFESQLYPGLPCPHGVCDVTRGEPVIPIFRAPVEGVDFQLTEAPPVDCADPAQLCLVADRFHVLTNWRTLDGDSGLGRPVELTADAGTFWFFDPDNVEVIVKVLDGCAINGHYWVFAAGLTDAEVELQIDDLITGTRRTYANPLATPFEPIVDTEAFATCSSSPALTSQPSVTTARPIDRRPSPQLGKGPCSAADDVLCLGDGRFQLDASWRAEDSEGDAQVVALTDDAGYLWFFEPDNVEVIAKVLDGCAINGHYWVFAAGLTDVEVALRVTDLDTGVVSHYLNALRTVFEPILDVEAFASCP